MKIIFGLGWAKSPQKNYQKLFKDSSAGELFKKYASRIEMDYTVEAAPLTFDDLVKQPGIIWICEREKKSKFFSSEELARKFQRVCDSGAKSLTIWIGGPDGVSAGQISRINPDLIWSFGPLTLPHELAAVIAAEQVYRAVSIQKNHPYHSGH